MSPVRIARRITARLCGVERHEITWLLVGLVACVLLLLFLLLAGEVMAGHTQAMDTRILRALRSPDDPARPIGPMWLPGMLEDLTALGGPTVTWLVILGVTGYLLFERRARAAMFVLVACGSGDLLTRIIKGVFSRPRPTIVPHLRDAFSTSFPSGHSMESAIVYVTLAAALIRVVRRPATRAYCLGLAILITGLVGVSRVFLGVHYPTDVAGGWIFGLFWASLCWLAAEWYDRRRAPIA